MSTKSGQPQARSRGRRKSPLPGRTPRAKPNEEQIQASLMGFYRAVILRARTQGPEYEGLAEGSLLADMMGVTATAARNYLAGRMLPNVERLITAAAHSGVSLGMVTDSLLHERDLEFQRVFGHGAQKGEVTRNKSPNLEGVPLRSSLDTELAKRLDLPHEYRYRLECDLREYLPQYKAADAAVEAEEERVRASIRAIDRLPLVLRRRVIAVQALGADLMARANHTQTFLRGGGCDELDQMVVLLYFARGAVEGLQEAAARIGLTIPEGVSVEEGRACLDELEEALERLSADAGGGEGDGEPNSVSGTSKPRSSKARGRRGPKPRGGR